MFVFGVVSFISLFALFAENVDGAGVFCEAIPHYT